MSAIVIAFVSSLFGQATSQIQGHIEDPKAGTVPSAEVRATQTETGAERSVKSGADGTYVLSNLPIGPYRITVTKTGFATYDQTGIVLQVATPVTVDITLHVGAVTEKVEVVADSTMVETQTPSIGIVIGKERILDLPLNGRNAAELIQHAGASVPGGKNTTSGFPGGFNIAVAGGQLSGVGYQLDGTMYNNLFDAVNLPFPFPDALQEFKVETSTMTAQNGVHASAAVSASIKSGTNQFHGSLFEFLRNGNMNAKDFFAVRRDTLKRNQFGGVVGGPILKNRLFFFAGYQGTRTRSDPANRPGNVPTGQMMAGDFSACSSFDGIRDLNGVPFAGGRIPVSRFSAQALKVVDFLPKSTDPCGKVSFGPISKVNEHQVLGRVDYTVDSRSQLFGRYMATKYAQPAPFGLSGNILDTVGAGIDDLAQTAALGYTFLATPNLVNQIRLAGNRVAVRRFNKDYFSGCDLLVIMHCYVPHQGILGVAGGFMISGPPATLAFFTPTYLTVADDVSAVRGSHTLAFGYSSFKYQHSQQVNVTASGQFGFSGIATGSGTTDFLLGQVSAFSQGMPSNVFTNKWGHGLYAQDTWKISRRINLNYGLRWEPFLPQALNNGAVYNFSLDAFKAGVHSRVAKYAPSGLFYPGDRGFHGKTGVNKRWNQVAPRVGVAFDLRGDGETSIRASAGIAYDFPNIQIMTSPAGAPPFASGVSVRGPAPFGNPYATYPGGNPFPRTTGIDAEFVPFGSFVAQQPDAKGPTTYTWNLSIQHQIRKDWLVSASYLGSQSVHLWLSHQLNPAVVIPCPTGKVESCNSDSNSNTRRLAYLANPVDGAWLGPVDTFDSSGNSSYHGLIISTRKRLRRGVSFDTNYTWSHCIGDVQIGSATGNSTAAYTDLNDRRRDRGNCSAVTPDGNQTLDHRHIFNFTAVLEAPQFQDRLLNQVASHWKLSASYRFLSASYLSVTNGATTDYALTGSPGAPQRANQLVDDVFCKPRNYDCWISPAAFGTPAWGTLGNAGRSNIAGPGFFGMDMALSRVFRVREKSLEARGEAFNLTNSVRLNAPVSTRNTPLDFGKVMSAQEPRILQVALKLMF